MREIQVVVRRTGRIILTINNLGDVDKEKFPFYFREETKKCEIKDDCDAFYKEYVFDAQRFEFVVTNLTSQHHFILFSCTFSEIQRGFTQLFFLQVTNISSFHNHYVVP